MKVLAQRSSCPVVLLLVLAGCSNDPAEPSSPASETLGSVVEGVVCKTITTSSSSDDAGIANDPVDPTLGLQNFGSGPAIVVGDLGSSHRQMLLRLDLSGIPAGSTIQSATLSLRKAQGLGPTVLTIPAHAPPSSAIFSIVLIEE